MAATPRFENSRSSRLRHCTSNVNPSPRFSGDDADRVGAHGGPHCGERSLLFLIPPLFLWGGWREAPGGVASYTRTAPTLHIVRSAHDLLSLRASFARLDPTSGRDEHRRCAGTVCNDIGTVHTHTSAISPRFSARVLPVVKPSEHQRAWGMPGARCTRSLACKIKKHTS
jgi:hypothetical protein